MQPSLATEWETSGDQLTWTFTLRDDVTFHDGSPMTSADVVYTFDRIIDEELNSAYRFATVKDITAPDDTTVVFELKEPTPNLLATLGGFKGLGIVEEQNVTSGEIKDTPIGTGPFAVAAYQRGQSIELSANPDYWGGPPEIGGVTFTFVSDPTVALQNLLSGEVQWTDNLPPQQVESLASNEDVELSTAPSNDYWYLAPNEARPPFDDVRVRQALAFGIDRDAIVEAAKFGQATVNQTAIPSTSEWYYDYEPYSYDPDRAKELLAEAGASDLSFELMVTDEYPETVAAAQVIASEMDDIGVTMDIRTLDFGTWLDEQGKGNFDVFMLSWLGNIDPDEFYYAQHRTGATFNFQGYSNPEVDQLLDEGQTETDTAARKEIYDQAAQQIVDDASYIYLYNPDVAQAWAPELDGYVARGDRAIRFADVTLAD